MPGKFLCVIMALLTMGTASALPVPGVSAAAGFARIWNEDATCPGAEVLLEASEQPNASLLTIRSPCLTAVYRMDCPGGWVGSCRQGARGFEACELDVCVSQTQDYVVMKYNDGAFHAVVVPQSWGGAALWEIDGHLKDATTGL